MRGDKKPYILGVDPGLSGALAVIDPHMETVVSLWDVPTFKLENGRRAIDTGKLATQMSQFIGDVELCVFEDVHSMPRDGVASAFSFGKSTGILIGMLSMILVPIQYVQPQSWKAVFGLSSDKDKSRELASKKYPHSQHLWELKKWDGRAEAVLLADFGKRFY